MLTRLSFYLLLSIVVFYSNGSIAKMNLSLERALIAIADVKADEEVMAHAALEVMRADQLLQQAKSGARGTRQIDLEHIIYLVEQQVAIAKAVAQKKMAEEDYESLVKEREFIILQAKLLEAEKARKDAERERLLSEARAEEAARHKQMVQEALHEQVKLSREAEQARKEAEQAKRLADAQAEEAELARQEAELARQSLETLKEQMSVLATSAAENEMIFTLGDVLFSHGSANLADSALHKLRELADFLKIQADRNIRIEGHTDSRGDANYNQRLSEQRASSVKSYLVSEGVQKDRIEVLGLGESKPIANNDTSEGRSRNRRVDIIVKKVAL